MPVPLWLAALAMTGGTMLQKAGQDRAMNAMADMQRAETARQQLYDQQAQTAIDASHQTYKDMPQTQDDKTQEVNTNLQRAITSQVGSYLPGANTREAPKIVKGASDLASQGAENDVRRKTEAFAKLGGLTQALFEGQNQLGRSGQDVNRMASFKRGSAGVLPLELQQASHKGDDLQMLGQLVSAAGQVALGSSLYSAGGPGAGAGAGTNGMAKIATHPGATMSKIDMLKMPSPNMFYL